MIYRRLGRTGLQVPLMSLGSGGHKCFGQRVGVPESDIHRLVHRALDLGINFFDTAPAYMDSESILGRALRGVPRDSYALSTKVLLVGGDQGDRISTPGEVVASVEYSLRRLQVSTIDLLLVGGQLQGDMYEQVVDSLFPVLYRLKQDGKVRYIGSTEKSSHDGSHQWLVRGLRDDLFDAVMVAYNMINQSAEREVFPLCKQNDVGTLVIYSVRNVFSQPERLREVIADLKARGVMPADALSEDDPLGWLVGGEVDSVISAAYKFVAANEAVSTVMTGTIHVDHLEENVRYVLGAPLPAAQVSRLKRAFGSVTDAIGN